VASSGPVITAGAETLAAGDLSGGLQFSFNRPDAYSDAELIAFASEHVHAHTTDHTMRMAASVAYGVTGHLTISANLPFINRNDLRAGHHSHAGGAALNTVEALGSVSGVGDLSLMAQYVLAHDHGEGWWVSALGGVKLPTGSTSERDVAGERLETEHQPGTGSWDPLLGFAAQKRWGATSAHVSALYQYSTTGAQATRLGDRMNVSGALVYTLGGTEHHEHSGSGHGTWGVMLESQFEHEGRQRIAGVVEADSGGEVLWLAPGVRYAASTGWSAAVSAGVPLWQDVGLSHPENSFRIVAQVGSRF
jgi:hypothetical protein